MNRKNRRSGFTLVEIIVTLVVLAILAVLLVPSMIGWIDKSQERACMRNRREAEKEYNTFQLTNIGYGSFGKQSFAEFLSANGEPLSRLCPSGGTCTLYEYNSGKVNAYCEIKCSVHDESLGMVDIDNSKKKEDMVRMGDDIYKLAVEYTRQLAQTYPNLQWEQKMDFSTTGGTKYKLIGDKDENKFSVSDDFYKLLNLADGVKISDGKIYFVPNTNRKTGEAAYLPQVDYVVLKLNNNMWVKVAADGSLEWGSNGAHNAATRPTTDMR